jgi:hypothetical protein
MGALQDDQKKALTTKIEDKTILDYAIENKNYTVASLLYKKNVDLLGKDDVESKKMQSLILLQALQNPSDEVEFREFIKLVSSSEKLTSEQKKKLIN